MRVGLALLGACSLAAVGCLVFPGAARACSCIPPPTEPAHGATNVPLNTRVWTHDPGAGSGAQLVKFRIKGGADVPVGAGALQWASGMRLLVLTPRTLLAPRTTYEIVPAFTAQVSTFTTGDSSDSTPPAPPNGWPVRACAALTPNSSCGPSNRSVVLEITGDETALAVLTRGETPPPPSLDIYPSSWPPQPNPVSFQAARPFSPYGLGEGSCIVWPLREPRGTVFYGAMDIAGNFSGWTRGGELGLPDLPPAGPDASASYCIEYGDGGVPLDAPADAGPADAGPAGAGVDVVPASADAQGVDAAVVDAGAGVDAGDAGAGPADKGGACSCRVPGRSAPGSGAPAVLLVATGLALGAVRKRTLHQS